MFDIEDEYAESDIPTTLIRSKADCPGIEVRNFSCISVRHLPLKCSYKQQKLPSERMLIGFGLSH